MTFVSLFAGIGAFDRALGQEGYRCVGQCEIEPYARSVLDRHWPDVPKHDDVQTIRPNTFTYPDLVTFGSPCTGLSQAGFKQGFEDERSALFVHAIRYIEELLDATDGRYPRYALWENVPNALSTNKGADYRQALSALLQTEVPVPGSGRWAKSGLARGNGRAVAWRVLDAQHFGLAQRRPRLFALVDLGGGCPGEVLLESEGLPGDPGPSEATGPKASSGAGRGVVADHGVVTAITRSLGAGGPDAAHAQAGWLIPEKSRTLSTSNNRLDVSTETFAVEPIPFDLAQITHPANRTRAEAGMKNGTLTATGSPHVVIHSSDGVHSDPITTSEPRSWTNEGTTFRLRNVVQQGWRVRRLTPVEGERLMGFPDGWTAWGVKNGAKVSIADTPRFRLIGNSLAVPVARWIGKRLRTCV